MNTAPGIDPLLPLVELAHVEERRLAQAGFGLGRVDLADLGLGGLQQVSVTRHSGSPGESTAEMLPQ